MKTIIGDNKDIYTYNIVTSQHQGLLEKIRLETSIDIINTVEYVYNIM